MNEGLVIVGIFGLGYAIWSFVQYRRQKADDRRRLLKDRKAEVERRARQAL